MSFDFRDFISLAVDQLPCDEMHYLHIYTIIVVNIVVMCCGTEQIKAELYQ